ncbi:metallophosphoesterase family protein [Tsukamurella soli]
MRFVHTADWQLGMTRHFLDADAQARFTDARLDAVSRIGDLARGREAEFVLVCGDVFEDNRLAPGIVARCLDRLSDMPCPVYVLPGNHDPLDAASIYTSDAFQRHRPGTVVVLDRAGITQVRPGVEILAAPWFSKHPAGDPLTAALVEAAPAAEPGVVRIAAGHGGTLSVGHRDQRLIDIDAVGAAVDAGALDYVALGDRHSVTQVRPGVWYSGAPEVTNFDHLEPGSGQVLVVDCAPDRPAQVEAVRVGTWAFRSFAFEVGSEADVAHVAAELAALPDKDRTVVKAAFTGTLSLAAKADLDDRLDALRARFAAIAPWPQRTDLAVLPGDGEFDSLALAGPVATTVDTLVVAARAGAGAPDDTSAADASGALALLYRLAGGVGR